MKKRADGRWTRSITQNGRTKVFYSRETTEAKANRDLEKQISAYLSGEEKKKTVGHPYSHVADEYQRYISDNVELSTYNRYRPFVARSVEYFGDIPVEDITAKDVTDYLATFVRQNFTAKTIKGYKSIVSSVLKFACSAGYIDSNVSQYATIPKKAKSSIHREALTESQQKIVEDNANSEFGIFVYFIMLTGLRIGEAAALTYGDIDFEKMTVTVNKSVSWASGQPVLKVPKTAAGVRTVPLPDRLADRLPKNKKSTALLYGEIINNETHYTRTIHRYCEALGIDITYHQLRHTYITILYEAGIGVKDAQAIAGHADVATTQNVYTHVREHHRQKTSQSLNNYLNTERE